MHTNRLQTASTHRSIEVDKNIIKVVIRKEYKRAIDEKGEKKQAST